MPGSDTGSHAARPDSCAVWEELATSWCSSCARRACWTRAAKALVRLGRWRERAQRAAAIIARAIEKEAGIASLLKANQIGTITDTDTDTLEAIRVSSKTERHVGSGSGWPGLLGEMALQVEMPELVHRSGLP